MDKKAGAWAITFIIIGGIVLLVLLVGGITAYQAYSVMTVTQEELEPLQQEMIALSQGDCSKLESVEQRADKVTGVISNACLNPILKALVEERSEGQFSCNNLDDVKKGVELYIQIMDAQCNNKSLEDIEIPEDIEEFFPELLGQ